MYDIISSPGIWEILMRVGCSVIAGALVGYERKRRQKEAGIRTHCMVALGSAVFGLISKYGFLDLIYLDGASVDLSRVAANVVTGVCFLGAGMIFVRSRSIKGLTTAAGIWAVSAIGLAFGCGQILLGALSTAVIFLIQYILHTPLLRLEGYSTFEFTCVINDWEKNLPDFREKLLKIDKNSSFTCIEKKDDGTVLVKFVVRIARGTLVEDMYTFMSEFPYIKSISD